MTVDFDINDPQNIWVAPDSYSGSDKSSVDGIGTYDDPHTSLADALKKASPGRRVVLLPGVYRGNQTIDVSGEEKSPVYITAHKAGKTIIENGCWYFYDTSDLVVSGLVFKNSPHGAISVVGQCRRNRFHSMSFVDCGKDGSASGTFYFGGAGGHCNIIEDCDFSRSAAANKTATNISPDNAAVALMISDGADDEFLKNHIVRRNHFIGYDMAIILGSGNAPDFESGHVVERNWVDDSRFDGITVKCGDVQIRRNIINKCGRYGISIIGGRDSMTTENRVSECGGGILIGGMGAMIVRNHIIGCKSSAVCALDYGPPAQNLVVHRNYIVNCGGEDGAIIINENTSGVIVKNTFYGSSPGCVIDELMKKYIAVNDNIEGVGVSEYVGDDMSEDVDTRGYLEASMPDESDRDESEDEADDIAEEDDINEDGDDGDLDDSDADLDGNDSDDIINYMFKNTATD